MASEIMEMLCLSQVCAHSGRTEWRTWQDCKPHARGGVRPLSSPRPPPCANIYRVALILSKEVYRRGEDWVGDKGRLALIYTKIGLAAARPKQVFI